MPDRAYQIAAGVLLLIVITIAYGGTFVLSVTRGRVPADDLQQKFFRAGHAHAGLLVILGLLALTLEQLNHVRAPYLAISFGILAAALLMPSGLFVSAISEGCRSYWDADPALGVLSDRPIRGQVGPATSVPGRTRITRRGEPNLNWRPRAGQHRCHRPANGPISR